MSEKEWDKLFDLIEKAVNLPGMSAGEKAAEIKSQAEARDQTTNLDEFAAVVSD